MGSSRLLRHRWVSLGKLSDFQREKPDFSREKLDFPWGKPDFPREKPDFHGESQISHEKSRIFHGKTTYTSVQGEGRFENFHIRSNVYDDISSTIMMFCASYRPSKLTALFHTWVLLFGTQPFTAKTALKFAEQQQKLYALLLFDVDNNHVSLLSALNFHRNVMLVVNTGAVIFH